MAPTSSCTKTTLIRVCAISVIWRLWQGIALRHHIADTSTSLCLPASYPVAYGRLCYILDGLMKNRSAIQPDTLHADTQGQSEPVFGLCRLLGIKLMPRMRNFRVTRSLYRPAKSIRYRHIDALFGGEIDWDLIATHAPDMIQVVAVDPSFERGHAIDAAAKALAHTSAAADVCAHSANSARSSARCSCCASSPAWISVVPIRAETTKIEGYNDFLADWVSFSGPVIKSGVIPSNREKQLKYASLVANAIMLSNVADLTEGRLRPWPKTASFCYPGSGRVPQPLTCASTSRPRFGRAVLDMDRLPSPLNPQPLPFEVAL